MKFAQIKLGLLCAMTSVHVIAKSNPEQILTGFYVDTIEQNSIDALKVGEQYFIPFDVFVKAIKITPSKTISGWLINSPIGKLSLDSSSVRNYKDKVYVNILAIKNLGIYTEFNKSDYAIKLFTPWNKTDLLNKSTISTFEPNIDYYPNSIGLNEININGGFNQSIIDNTDTVKTEKNIQIGFTGNAFGGLWGGRLKYPDASTEVSSKKASVDVSRLYWAHYGKKSAVQIGTNSQPSFNVVNQNKFSGITAAYSNKGINKHLSSFNQYNNTLLKASSSDYRTISGQGPVGGIAELRINANPVAKVRIGTDKKYQFINLNLNQLYEHKDTIEIALYEHNFSNHPIKVVPFSFNKRKSNVATGEFLTEVGVGKIGNVLDIKKEFNDNSSSSQTVKTDTNSIDDTTKRKENVYTYAYTEYGLYNNVALRSGLTYSDQLASLIGFNVGISPKVNLDVSYQNKATNQTYESLLSYSSKHVGATYQFRYQKAASKLTKTNKSHALFLYVSPISSIDLSMNAHQNEIIGIKDKSKKEYITAGANFRLHENVQASLNFDKNHDLQKNINVYLPKYYTRTFFNHSNKQHGINTNTEILPNLLLGLEWRHYKQTKSDWIKAYSEFSINDRSKLFVNVSGQQQKQRYEIGWHNHLNNGTTVSAGYDFNIDQSQIQSDKQHHFYLQFNLPLIHIPQQGYRIQQYNRNNNLGSVIADVDYDESLFTDVDNTLTVLLNDRATNARHLSDGKYLIENLKPDIYKLSLSNKNLPIEYSADDLPSVTIKVNRASTTLVPYHLEKRYGFSGKLDGVKNNKQAVTVDIYQGNKKITSTQSNVFGYYQVLGLKAGDYIVKARGYKDTHVKLSNGFLFEVDLNAQSLDERHDSE